MRKSAILVFSLVSVLIVALAGYFGFSTSKKPEPKPIPQTVSVTSCDVEQTITAPGNLVNVNQVGVRVGDVVKAGQVLAELDPVAITQAQVDLLEAQQELQKLQTQRTALDYPRATDAFLKDYRKKINLQKEKVGLLSDAYHMAIDPEQKAAILTELSNTQTELFTMETNLKWSMRPRTCSNNLLAVPKEMKPCSCNTKVFSLCSIRALH